MVDVSRGLARRSIVGVLWTSLSMGAFALAEIVALIVLARLLSPGAFGLYAATLVVIKFSSIFSGLGVAPAIVQRPTLEDRHLRVGFTLSLALSFAIAAIVWFGAPVLADFLRLPDLAWTVRAASLVFLLQGLSMVALASAQRALRFRWLAGLDAAAFTFGFVVVAPILALLDLGIWALVGGLIGQHALRSAILLASQPHPKFPMLEWRTIAELFYFGGGFTLGRIFNYIAGQADKLVVGRWIGAEALGLYSLSSQLMTTPAVLAGQVLDRVLFPTMALVQQEPARLARAYRSAVAACALVVLPLSAIVAIVAPEVVLVLLGPGWEGVVLPLQVLALGMLFRTSYKLSDSVARATGAVYARAWRQAAFAVAVAAGALAGHPWGVGGVALGVVAAIVGNFLLMAGLSLRLTGMRWTEFGVAHLPGLALAGVVGASVWLLVDLLRSIGLSSFLLLLDVMALAAVEGILLCWLAPGVFLGRDGRSVIRLLAGLTPRWIQRRSE